MDLVDDVKETHTYDYFVSLNCNTQQFQKLCKHFSFELEPLEGEPSFNVADWSVEDRKELQEYLRQHHISYTVERVLRNWD